VNGNTSAVHHTHPTIALLLKRLKNNSKPTKRGFKDKEKIALCIEGGGMRGCVSAGSAAAINFLGLNDAFDVVYGSSAGAMVGAYFVSRQYSGVQIYHGKFLLGIISSCSLYLIYTMYTHRSASYGWQKIHR
jgi:hypothetical protein